MLFYLTLLKVFHLDFKFVFHNPFLFLILKPFSLSKHDLDKREIIYIDIANDPVSSSVSATKKNQKTCKKSNFLFKKQTNKQDYKEDEDPTKFLSTKTGRGQLKPDWKDTTRPIMCAYKLVTVEFKWFGLQSRVEKFIQTVQI